MSENKEIPGNNQAAAMKSGTMDSYLAPRQNSSDGAWQYIELHMYAVVAGCLILVVFATLGTVFNVATLLTMRRRQFCQLRYLLLFALLAADLLLCIVWAPLAMGHIVRSYTSTGMHHAACYVQVVALHFLVSVIVLTAASIAIQRLCQLWHGQNSYTTKVVLCCGVVSLLIPAIFSAAIALEYHNTADYDLCVLGKASHTQMYASTLATMLFMLLSLIATIVAFVVIFLMRRNVGSERQPIKRLPQSKTTVETSNSRRSLP